MALKLEDISHCLHGVVPALIATSSNDGEPNVTLLSHVYYVNASHVALSCQFFNKTRANVSENPRAFVEVNDPFTFQAYCLELKFCRAESSGPLFDLMRERLNTIAYYTGMLNTFPLQSADVYEVVNISAIDGYLMQPTTASEPDPDGPMTELRALHSISARINRATSLEHLIDSTLEALSETLGFKHSMLLLLDEAGDAWFTVASHGYGEHGVGAEVPRGAGLIGRAAEQNQILRAAGMISDLRYGRAIRDQMQRRMADATSTEVPLPGLPDAQSQLAIPLSLGQEVLGVLAVESVAPLQFEHLRSELLEIVANQWALALDRMTRRDDQEASSHAEQGNLSPPREAARNTVAMSKKNTTDKVQTSERHVFWYFPNDDCVFLNGEYLVRNMPGRILWRLLNEFHSAGRREFTNRELRLDPSLSLPAIKDNLESRLILLRRRLEAKCPRVRLVPIRRGRFSLEIQGQVELVER